MGNVCCNSRPTKLPLEKPKAKPKGKLIVRQRRSVQLPGTHKRLEKHEHEDPLSGQSTAPINTTLESWLPQEECYHSLEVKLPPLSSLPEDFKDQLQDVIEANAKDFGQMEEVVGYVKATVMGDMSGERLLVLSTVWLYVLDPSSLRIYRKVRLSSIQLVTFSPERELALIHTGGNELEGDLLFSSLQTQDVIEALEVVTHTSLQHYIPVWTAESPEAVRKKLNALSKAALLAYHTSEFLEVTRVFVCFGEVGENRLFFRRTRVCSQQHPEIKCQLLLSTRALYILSEDFSLLEKVELQCIEAVTVSNTSDKVVVHSTQGDRLFFVNNSFVEALDKAAAARGLERLQVNRKSNMELDILYCRSREALSAMPEGL